MTDTRALAERLSREAALSDEWHNFQLGQEPPPPQYDNMVAALLREAADALSTLSKEKAELERQLAEADGALAWRAKVRRDLLFNASDYHRIEQEAIKRHASRQSGG